MSNKSFKFKLSVLRDIGWQHWDPIGLLPKGASWEDYPEFADEYDGYLTYAAGQLARGATPKDVALYFDQIVADRMGLRSNYTASEEVVRIMIERKSEWMR